MTKPAVELENVSKLYRLGTGYRTLREALTEAFQRRRASKQAGGPASVRPEQAGPRSDSFWALKNISATIERGDIVGIIGRNGAGKSTLLKVLSKITAPTEGRVVMRGRVGSLLEVGAGFHPDLSGRENIFLNGAVLGMKKADIVRQLDQIIAFADIGAFIDTPVKRYSSGMYVRLAFAVAAHLDPDILIVDEVLAVGDARFQAKCLGKMQEISSGQGRTVFFVSHNLESVQRLCNHCMYLQFGQIVMTGPTADVVRMYLGSERTTPRAGHWIDFTGALREGSGEARFSKARYFSDNRQTGCSDQPLEVEFVIEATRSTKIQSLAIGIRDEYGRRLVNADLGAFGRTYKIPEGTTTFKLRIEALHLRPGIYSVALWLARYAGAASGDDIFDYIERAFNLEVVEGDDASGRRTSIGQAGVVTCEFTLLDVSHPLQLAGTLVED